MSNSSRMSFFVKRTIRVYFLIVCLCDSTVGVSQSPFIPSDINELKIWLRSDTGLTLTGNLVDQWDDISGNGNNAFQATILNKPVWNPSDTLLNDYPVIKFDGLNSRLETAFMQPDIYSVFVIYAHRQGDVGSLYSTKPFPPVSGYPIQRSIDIWPNSDLGNYSLSESINLRNLFANIYDFQNDSYKTFLNGTLRGASSSLLSKAAANIYIGQAAGETLNGSIAEILIYDTALHDTSRVKVETYLMNRYAPPVDLGTDIASNYFCDTTLSAGKRFISFIWNTGATTQSIQVDQAGTYSVAVMDIFGRTSSDVINVSYPIINSPFPDTTICYRDTLIWNTQLDHAGYDFLWSDNSTDSVLKITQSGQYYVTVMDTLGCSLVSNTITVTVDNFGQTASLGPDIYICSGNSIALTSGSSQAVSYSWSTGETTSSIEITSTDTYAVSAQDANGCFARDTINVNVKGVKPLPDFSAPPVCFGSATFFSDLSIPTTPEIITGWVWDFGDGNNSVVQSPLNTYTASGTYTVSLMVTTDSGCSAVTQKIILVHAKPSAVFTSSPACSGGSTLFADQSSISTGALAAWNWNFGDSASGLNNTSALQNPAHMYAAAGTYTVQLVVSSDSGCTDTMSNTVIVFQSPAAAFTATDVCQGTATSFTNNSIGANGWQWNFGDGTPIITTQNSSHTYSSAGIYNVTLMATSAASQCTHTIINTVTVYSLPNPVFYGDSVCLNSPLQFVDSSYAFPDSISLWNWQFGSMGSSQQQNPMVTFTSSGTYSVTLSVTSSKGCTGSIMHPVVVMPLPTASFTFSPTHGALPLNVSFSSSLSSGATAYQWYFGDSGQSIMQNPVNTYTATGLFPILLIVQSQFGCIDSMTDTLYIAFPVLDIAVKTVSALQQSNTIKITAWLYNTGTLDVTSIELSTYLNNGTPIREYWVGLSEPGTLHTYTFNSSFEITNSEHSIVCVDVKSVNGAEGDEILSNNHFCTPIITEFTLLDPFPNPTNEDIYFLYILPESGNVNIRIFDVMGRVVETLFDESDLKGLNTIRYNTIKLDKGIYVLKLFYQDKIATKVFVKE